MMLYETASTIGPAYSEDGKCATCPLCPKGEGWRLVFVLFVPIPAPNRVEANTVWYWEREVG